MRTRWLLARVRPKVVPGLWWMEGLSTEHLSHDELVVHLIAFQHCFVNSPAKMSPGMTLFSVQAVLILGTEDGARIFSKYFSPPHGMLMITPDIVSCWSRMTDGAMNCI